MQRIHIPVMNVGTSVNPPQISAGSTMEEGGRYKSPPAAHKCIFHLLNILGVLLQVKLATGNLPSPFVTDHNTVVMLIAVLLTYVGTLRTANILRASNNTSIYEVMNNISLLCGTLALVLLVLLLVPAFGWFTLACWALYFVIIATKSFQILRGLCTAAVGYVREKYQTLIRLCTAAVGYVCDKIEELMMSLNTPTDHTRNIQTHNQIRAS
ncbi:unnamed protein product [Malus baccata var. baccata]